MEKATMEAWMRGEIGKGNSGRLRKAGFVPAVLYGPGVKENIHIKLKSKDLERLLHAHAGTNVLIDLAIEGEKPKTVILKQVTRHPVEETVSHVDLMNILKDRKITVEVPVVIVGRAEGVGMGGILQQEARILKIECLPHNIPDRIDVDVTALRIGQSIHVKDLKLAEGLRVLDDEKHTIVLVSAPTVEAEVKTAEEITAELKESFAEKEKPEEEKEKEKKE